MQESKIQLSTTERLQQCQDVCNRVTKERPFSQNLGSNNDVVILRGLLSG